MKRRTAASAALAGLVVALVATFAVQQAPLTHASASAPASTVAPQRHYPLTARLRAMVPKSTLIAHLLKRTPGYATAKSHHPDTHIPEYWYDHRAALPVVARKHGRMKVRLERRPNGSTTWIRTNVAGYSRTKSAILIDLTYRRLFWFRAGKLQGSAPVGIGAADAPTPTGKYFIAFHSPPPGPGYGSVVLATSAHSTTFKDFEGFDDAIVGIHGPLGEAAAIRPNGAAVSHGCIRMLNGALNKIRPLPDGTPIIITY